MRIGTFLKSSLFIASVLCATTFQAAAQAGGGGGGAGGGRGMGILTQEQRTQMREAIQGEMPSLQEKLAAAQKDFAKAVVSGANEETLKAKIEAIQKVETQVILVRAKAVKAISLTSEQKTQLENARDGGYMQLFGMGGFGGMGGARRAGGPGGGGNQ